MLYNNVLSCSDRHHNSAAFEGQIAPEPIATSCVAMHHMNECESKIYNAEELTHVGGWVLIQREESLGLFRTNRPHTAFTNLTHHSLVQGSST
ncbi:hypothetical protein L798_05218 [Zootermopsis nevadensis]|uniref:Uncharacterized protein n=1 Tax=Zootermopsis nevadensis TaxID=136037 RepID=A0A067R8M7_ZOONE|nr:hypothetical protein L798_05218 [Zootermopsis nevadensis]